MKPLIFMMDFPSIVIVKLVNKYIKTEETENNRYPIFDIYIKDFRIWSFSLVDSNLDLSDRTTNALYSVR